MCIFQHKHNLPDELHFFFNKTANSRWSDFKNRKLKHFYDAAGGDFEKAIKNHPDKLIGKDEWSDLCKRYERNAKAPEANGDDEDSVQSMV